MTKDTALAMMQDAFSAMRKIAHIMEFVAEELTENEEDKDTEVPMLSCGSGQEAEMPDECELDCNDSPYCKTAMGFTGHTKKTQKKRG